MLIPSSLLIADRFWFARKLELGRIALEYPPNLRQNPVHSPERQVVVEKPDLLNTATLPSLDIARGDYEGW